MDELQKLYDVLIREGKYTKSFEEFQTKWSQDQSYKDKVYDVVLRDRLYTKDRESFFQKYSVSQPALVTAAQPADLKKKAQGDTALASADISLALPKIKEIPKAEPDEADYFEGAFGNVLRGFDKISPIGIGDFVDDMARSVAQGYRQSTVAQEADNLLLSGTKATPEQIQKFIDANKNVKKLGTSKEAEDYNKIYDEEGGGVWGFVKGIANNPSYIGEMITSSLVGLATNADALKAGAAGIGTGAAIGATTGAGAGTIALPVIGTVGGAGAGAIAGAASAVPYAMGLAGSIMEMGSYFAEGLEEQLDGKEMTKENVKTILENPEKLQALRNKAIARGAIIGAVDAFTGKMASKVGAKILTKSAAKSATGSATKGAVIKATAAGSAIESVGGSIGEAAARGALGQEMDTGEILMEGVAELPSGIRSTIQARLAKPSYKVNGAKATAEQVDEIINTMSPTDLAKTKIEIKNDYKGREFKIQDKIVTNSIKEQVRQGNPELNEPSLNAITELEKELKKLEGNTTQTGKDKAAAVRGQIKDIQENQLQEEAVAETVAAKGPELAQKRVDRIAEIENTLNLNETNSGVEGGLTLPNELKTKLETELQTLKLEQDAIQKQATNEGLLRSQQTGMGLQQVVEGDQGTQVVTTGTQEAITPEGTQEVVSSKTQVNVAPYFNTRVESIQEAEKLRQSPEYKQYKQSLKDLADIVGIKKIAIDDILGGYKNDAGEDFTEVSNKITLEDATLDQAEEYAALAAALSPEVQEASIASRYVTESAPEHNANEYEVKVSNVDEAVKSLKEAGISNFSIDETNGIVSFIDVLDFADPELQDKIGTFVRLLDKKGINYEQSEYQPVESRYVDKGKRKEILRRIKSQGTETNQRGQNFSSAIERAIQRDAEFQSVTADAYLGIEAAAPKVGEFEAKAKKLAEDIENFELPSWFSASLPEGTQKSGLSAADFKKLAAKSVIEVGKLMDKGVEFAAAVREAVQELVNALGESNRAKIEQTVKDYFNKGEGVSENELPGYDALSNKVDAMIATQTNKKVDPAKIEKNVIKLVQQSDAYKQATDVQKEQLVREARKKLGLKEKSAPSIKRLRTDSEPAAEGESLFNVFFDAVKKDKKVTMTEMSLLKKQIKDLARGAKDAKKLWRQASSGLTKELKELASSGKITAKQLAAVLRKFSSVDMFNEKSIDKFVDYIEKIFSDAEYANKLDFARSTLKTAKKNIATKIGIADGLYNPLNRLFSVDPSLIPDSVLDKYLELVDMFGKRQAVLDLKEKSQVKKITDSILDTIAEEQSIADELADRFNESSNKVFGDNGNLDFAESIKEMVKQEEITQEEADIMRKYKSDIMPQVEPKKMTEQEIAEEKEGLIKEIENAEIDGTGLSTEDERSRVNRLKKLIKTKAIDNLSNTELKNLLKVISNINNNYFPHYAQVMIEKMNSVNEGGTLSSAIGKSKLPKLSLLYAKFKNLFTGKGAVLEMVRRNPLYYIDQVFGEFKNKDIFNSLLKLSAEAEAKFTSELKRVQNILENAEEKIAKSYKLDSNKTLMSKFKIMTYMIQLEYESNVGDKQVNQAADYLKATVKHIDEGKSSFSEKDAKMLQEILDTYGKVVGKDENNKDIIEIDNEKLYNSFNQSEKSAIKDIRGINESLREKAEITATIIRGDKISPLNNYVHLNVLHETQPNELTSGSAFVTEYNNSMRPSTKAKSLIARTGKVSPLNFDVFASAQRGAKFVLMDYNLTEPIRTARKTLNQATSNLESEGRIPKEKRQVLNAIRDAFEESIENLLTNSYISNAFLDDAIDYISKQGYRSVLAGASRFISELSSNAAFAIIADPAAAKTGYDYKDVIMSVDAPTIMNNVDSIMTNRVFPTDTLSGKLVDTNVLKQASGIKGGKAKEYIANKIQQIFNRTGKKYINAVELTADALISTPDKIVMRPIWFGSFANEFKKATGQDIDFKKIAAKDEAYMSKHKDAINKAKTFADERSVFTGAADNAFMGILKGTPKPNQTGWLRAFNNFNNFMTRFLIFEYATARTGINAAMGNGTLTKKQGAALVAAVTTRMMVYSLLTQALGNGLMGIFFDDEEEEDDDSILQNIGQAFASAFSSLVLGRNFGNSTKLFINEGVERANEKYLDFLRTGEYDRYEDNIQNSLVPQEKKGRQTGVWDYVRNMGGAFTPFLKTTDLIIKNASSEEPKTKEAKERREKENTMRIPLEIAGNAGLIPMYKDIRKVVMDDIYKDLDKNKGVERQPLSENQNDQIKALRQLKETKQDEDAVREINKKIREIQATGEQAKKYEEANKREAAKKKRLLYDSETGERYDNETELKRYNPKLYNENFGPQSDWYQDHKAEKDINKALNKEVREMEDEEYEYVAPPKKERTSKKNSDGSVKSSSRKYTRKDANGKVISSYSRTSN